MAKQYGFTKQWADKSEEEVMRHLADVCTPADFARVQRINTAETPNEVDVNWFIRLYVKHGIMEVS